MVQVVALVHSDLHDDQTLNTINFLASSLLWITLDKEEKGKKNILIKEITLFSNFYLTL